MQTVSGLWSWSGGGVSMFSNSSRLESANWELPHSSWAIPVVTGLVVLLAVTSALA
jgi:hypothetical protein